MGGRRRRRGPSGARPCEGGSQASSVSPAQSSKRNGFVWGWGVRGGPLGPRCGIKGHLKLAGTPACPSAVTTTVPAPPRTTSLPLVTFHPYIAPQPPPQTARPPASLAVAPARDHPRKPVASSPATAGLRLHLRSSRSGTIGLPPARPPARLLAGEGGRRSLNETRDSPPPRGLLQPCAPRPSLQVPPGSPLPAPSARRQSAAARPPPATVTHRTALAAPRPRAPRGPGHLPAARAPSAGCAGFPGCRRRLPGRRRGPPGPEARCRWGAALTGGAAQRPGAHPASPRLQGFLLPGKHC